MIQLGCHGGSVCKAVAGVLNSNNKDGQHVSEVAGKHANQFAMLPDSQGQDRTVYVAAHLS